MTFCHKTGKIIGRKCIFERIQPMDQNMDNNQPQPQQPAQQQPVQQPQQTEDKTKQPLEITISLPTHGYFMSGIRDFTLSLIKNTSDFSEQWAYRFQSVVDELCNNAIEHGSAPGELIIITFKVDRENLRISVEDTGTGPRKMTAEELKKLVEETRKQSPETMLEKFRGRGLAQIVSEWTDELNFIDSPNGGMIVEVTKKLNDDKTQELKQELSFAGNQTHIVV